MLNKIDGVCTTPFLVVKYQFIDYVNDIISDLIYTFLVFKDIVSGGVLDGY